MLFGLCLGAVTANSGEGQLPTGWGRFVSGSEPADYEIGVDETVRHGGKASGFVRAKAAEPKGFATLLQDFRANDYRGKRLRLSGYVKADKIDDRAGLWMRIDSDTKTLAFDNMQDRGIKGTSDWKKYDVVLDVPKDSVNIAFGILLRGKGQAWVDDLRFEVVGNDVPTTQMPVSNKEFPVKKNQSKQEKPLSLDFEK